MEVRVFLFIFVSNNEIMANLLTKAQVIADFKLNFLPLIKDESIDFIENIWNHNLNELNANKRISKSQKETWIFPKKDLGL